jgi:cytochrome c-type biogenesis protein CcmH
MKPVILLSALGLVVVCATVRAELGPAGELESRLFAPCCYTQTLDVHESDLASQLRREIHARIGAGEAAQQIEDDLAVRYGERIRAVPRGRDPRAFIPALIAVVMAASFGVLLRFGMGWRRRSALAVPVADAEQYDEALDAELARGEPRES